MVKNNRLHEGRVVPWYIEIRRADLPNEVDVGTNGNSGGNMIPSDDAPVSPEQE